MASNRQRPHTARELKPRIQRLSWKRLSGMCLATRSRAVRRMIEVEARRCGYRMSGFVLAQALRRTTEAAGDLR